MGETLACAPAHRPRDGHRLSWLHHYANKARPMNPTRIVAILLILSGGLGLAYGGFSYTKETTGLKLGPLELKVQEKERVNIPMVLSGAAVLLGVFLLVAGRQK